MKGLAQAGQRIGMVSGAGVAWDTPKNPSPALPGTGREESKQLNRISDLCCRVRNSERMGVWK